MVELTHVFLFAICCTLALLLTFRLPFPSPITLLSLRIGLILTDYVSVSSCGTGTATWMRRIGAYSDAGDGTAPGISRPRRANAFFRSSQASRL